jgi:hypothetical protein
VAQDVRQKMSLSDIVPIGLLDLTLPKTAEAQQNQRQITIKTG